MPAFLVPVDPGQCLIPLEKAVVLIGRQADCDVSLTNSRKISRKHCCIAQVNNKFIVRDLGSTNGVFLNGNRITKEAELAVGDQLTIGDVRFQVQNDASVNEKKKPPKKSEAVKTAEPIDSEAPAPSLAPAPPAPAPVPPPPAPVAPVARRSLVTPAAVNGPALNSPVILEDSGKEFAVESTNQHPVLVARRNRPIDVVPIDEDSEHEGDQPIGLNTEG